MFEHDTTHFGPELPGSEGAAFLSTSSRRRRASRLLHRIEFFAGVSRGELLTDAEEAESDPWSMADADAQPRDLRLRQLIQAAGRGWISDRARIER